ncbi:hypothetical protein GCM10011392_30950 [Wenxinia marina]|nr:hypothetical protein GCM10011392_30950 [Wenxinia marina]
MFISIPRVTRVRVSAVEGSTDEAAGTRRTSSKVRASRISMRRLLGLASFGGSLWHGWRKAERAFCRLAFRPPPRCGMRDG